jgi:hypothetical protein
MTASPARTSDTPTVQASTPPPPASNGSIEGVVGYPADLLLAQAVYAVATDGSRYYYVETIGFGRPFSRDDPERGAYRLLGVAPGEYFVLTAVRDLADPRMASGTPKARHFDAAYTKSVQCGLTVSCTDHSLVPVHVSPGATVIGIDPGDWYVNNANYPVIPGAGPPGLDLGTPPAAFQTPKQAAVYFAQLKTSARYVQSSADCQVNRSCLWFTAEHERSTSAYFTSEAGTNGLFRICTFYLTNTPSGWQYFDSNCRRVGTAFPAVGSTGRLVIGFGGTGCIDIHAAPGLTTKVITCLPENTAVTIDEGPDYLPESTPSPDFGLNFWWHVARRGWVAHRYVMYSA